MIFYKSREIDCRHCDGKAYDPAYVPTEPMPTYAYPPCPVCKGTGVEEVVG